MISNFIIYTTLGILIFIRFDVVERYYTMLFFYFIFKIMSDKTLTVGRLCKIYNISFNAMKIQYKYT